MRYLLVALSILLCPVLPAQARIGIDIELPGINIGINMPAYPRLVRVPGYPVYYDPAADSNYFFYDGLYWVYQSDNWYASSWYNGPWERVDRYDVPLYLLRITVRYYRHPPQYFRGWRADAPPRWGEHWGNDWERRRSGWDRWDRRSVPAPAPLPTYQRQYSGDRYPRAPEQQLTIRDRNYRYQPREAVTRQHFQPPTARARQAPAQRQAPTGAQRAQPSEPRQQPRTQVPQQRTPDQSVPKAQPRAREQERDQSQRRQPAQAQRIPPAPQGKAPPERKPAQGNAPEKKPAQGNAPEKKPAPQAKGRDKEGKGEPQGEGPRDRKEERGS
jgi:hypothetical protein